MTVVGFVFKKILVEKKKATKGKISVNNNVSIKEVEKTSLNVGDGRSSLRFGFEYDSKYEPGVGIIEMYGDIMYLCTEEAAKGIMDSWSKKNSVPRDVMLEVLNNILYKCNIEALILSRDVGLPSPIQLPKAEIRSTSEKTSPEKSKGAQEKK